MSVMPSTYATTKEIEAALGPMHGPRTAPCSAECRHPVCTRLRPSEHDIPTTHATDVADALEAARRLLRHPFARRRAIVEQLRAAMAKVDGAETLAVIPQPKVRLQPR